MAENSKNTPKKPRFYLVFLDENYVKITLSFRHEKSIKQHIKEQKIKKDNIIYTGIIRPWNESITSRSRLLKAMWAVENIIELMTKKKGGDTNR